MKKFLSILLAAMMVLAMASVAFAAGEYSITISNSVAGYTYEVYQVFSGTISDGKLIGIQWGNGVTSAKLIEKLLAEGIIASTDDTAEEVALAMNGADATKTKKFADAVASEEVLATAVKTVNTQTNGAYVVDGLDAGYYFVKSTVVPQMGTDSAYILLVSGNTTTAVKNGTVTHQKKVKDKNDTDNTITGWQDSADWDIGDTVPFQLTGTLPADYANFDTFYFAFHDVMSAGLTLDATSFAVKVDGVAVDSTKYNVKLATDNATTDGCTFEIEFTDLKTAVPAAVANSIVTVEFNATLNSNAVLGSTGNPNESKLVFSNDAKNEESKGTSPVDKVIVFTYKVVINKVDQDGKALPGATFKLEKKVNGSWTELTLVSAKEGTEFSFTGLDDGDYKLTEITTPAGYNGIDPIEFTVTAAHDTESDDPKLTALTGNSFTGDVTTGTLTTSVENRSGATLPSTGGIGTTLFYLFGSIMAAGSALILVVRRRAEAEEE